MFFHYEVFCFLGDGSQGRRAGNAQKDFLVGTRASAQLRMGQVGIGRLSRMSLLQVNSAKYSSGEAEVIL